MGVSSSESHDLTAFYEMLSASFGVLSQNTGFYLSLDRLIETTLGPLNLGPGGGSYNETISPLQRSSGVGRWDTALSGRGGGRGRKKDGCRKAAVEWRGVRDFMRMEAMRSGR